MEAHDAPAESRFLLGKTVVTSGALSELSADDILLAFLRHAAGDWGDLEAEDEARNEKALMTEGRLFSTYLSATGGRFYVITECDRSVTTVLLPHEY